MSTTIANLHRKSQIRDNSVEAFASPNFMNVFKISDDFSTFTWKFPSQLPYDTFRSNSTYLDEVNLSEKLSNDTQIKISYKISEDPMKKIEGKDADQMMKLLSSRSVKNNIEILKEAAIDETSASFKLNLQFKS